MLLFTGAILNQIELREMNATKCGDFLFGINYFSNNCNTWRFFIKFGFFLAFLLDYGDIYLCGPSWGCWIGKLCGLPQLLSVYKPFQQQLNTWMLCVSKRKRKEGIEHRLCCTTQRLVQGLKCWIRTVDVTIVQLKLHKETGLSYPELLPWLELMYLPGVKLCISNYKGKIRADL